MDRPLDCPSPALPPRFEAALAAQLRAWPWVDAVWLFGSRARGDALPRSDIDLAFATPRATPREWSELTEWLEESAPTLVGLDAVRLDRASSALQAAVAREGVLLFQRGEAA